MKTLREMMDLIESAQTIDEGISDFKKLFQEYSELYYDSHEGWDNNMGAEEYSKMIERKMDEIERKIWTEFGNKGVKKLQQYAHDYFWGKRNVVEEQEPLEETSENPIAKIEQLVQYK